MSPKLVSKSVYDNKRKIHFIANTATGHTSHLYLTCRWTHFPLVSRMTQLQAYYSCVA